MQITEYIRLNFGGRQDRYAEAMGISTWQVSRFCNLNSCLVDSEGWPHTEYLQRNKRT